jgi:hypothetical protein
MIACCRREKISEILQTVRGPRAIPYSLAIRACGGEKWAWNCRLDGPEESMNY